MNLIRRFSSLSRRKKLEIKMFESEIKNAKKEGYGKIENIPNSERYSLINDVKNVAEYFVKKGYHVTITNDPYIYAYYIKSIRWNDVINDNLTFSQFLCGFKKSGISFQQSWCEPMLI